MNLYYTVSSGYNEAQPNPDRSLGGYKSSTLVGNDDFGNMFDEISIMTIRSGRDEYRAIIIRNDFATGVMNLTAKVILPESAICTYKLAVAPLTGMDKYRRRFMENVMTVNNKPFHATFMDIAPDAVLEIGNLNPEEEIGLWICRHVDKEAAKAQYENVCEPDPNDPTGRVYKEVSHPIVESVDIEFTWQ